MDTLKIEIVNIENARELPKVAMSVRVEGKDSDWRPIEGHWFRWVDGLGCIHWHREPEG